MGTTAEGTEAQGRSWAQRIGTRRPDRLQIALSADERRLLTERAREAGAESVAAFVRARTLGQPVMTGVTPEHGVLPVGQLKG